jgi:hypothetical protein
LIELTKAQWDALFQDVMLAALKMTSTKVEKRKATQRDKAMEAVQAAFDRLLRVKPPGLDSTDAIRRYLVWTVRSTLANAGELAESRARHETAAATDQQTVDPPVLHSAEQMNLGAAQEEDDKRRDERRMQALRRELAGDRIALGTIDCITQGTTEPAEQAEILECPIEEIYNARKRRKRAVEKVLADERGEGYEEKE